MKNWVPTPNRHSRIKSKDVIKLIKLSIVELQKPIPQYPKLSIWIWTEKLEYTTESSFSSTSN